MIHHHGHTSIFGAIYGVVGYFVGIASDYIPEPTHWYSSILPTALAAFVGWVVTKLCNWLWPTTKTWCVKLINKLSFWKLWKHVK